MLSIDMGIRQTCMFGGYGGGKSNALCRGVNKVIGRNGKEKRRKDCLPVPKGALISPTFRSLMESTLESLYEVTDPRWIRRVRGQPHPHIEYVNDFVLELHSSRDTLEGSNYCLVAGDEMQHRYYSAGKIRTNYISRVRDPNAEFKAQLFAGISEAGHAQQMFDRPPSPPESEDGGNWTIMVASHENPAVDATTLAAIAASCTSAEAADILKGKWHLAVGAVFANWDPVVHLTPEAGNPNEVTHLGIDQKGKLLAVVFGQRYVVRVALPNFREGGLGASYEDFGIHIVDQLLPENTGTEGICQQILRHPRKYKIGAGSIIMVGPDITVDDENTLKRFFPGAKVNKAEAHPGAVEDRIKRSCRALRDGQGMVRIKVWSGLRGMKRGVIESFEGERRHEITGKRVQDKFLEHAGDAQMQLVEGILPRQHILAPRDLLPTIARRGFSVKKG